MSCDFGQLDFSRDSIHQMNNVLMIWKYFTNLTRQINQILINKQWILCWRLAEGIIEQYPEFMQPLINARRIKTLDRIDKQKIINSKMLLDGKKIEIIMLNQCLQVLHSNILNNNRQIIYINLSYRSRKHGTIHLIFISKSMGLFMIKQIIFLMRLNQIPAYIEELFPRSEKLKAGRMNDSKTRAFKRLWSFLFDADKTKN